MVLAWAPQEGKLDSEWAPPRESWEMHLESALATRTVMQSWVQLWARPKARQKVAPKAAVTEEE